jgi:hypothetical protein
VTPPTSSINKTTHFFLILKSPPKQANTMATPQQTPLELALRRAHACLALSRRAEALADEAREQQFDFAEANEAMFEHRRENPCRSFRELHVTVIIRVFGYEAEADRLERARAWFARHWAIALVDGNRSQFICFSSDS